ADDVLASAGDPAGRRRGPLDLGDDVEARAGQPFRDRARRRRGPDACPEVRAPWMGAVADGQLALEVRPSPCGDLADDAQSRGPRIEAGTRRCGLDRSPRPRCERHAGCASIAGCAARSRASSSAGLPASIVSWAATTP